MTETILVPDGISPAVGWRAWRASLKEERLGGSAYTYFYSSMLIGGATPAPKKVELPPKVALFSSTRDEEWPAHAPIEAKCDKTHLVAKHSEYDPRTGMHSLKWAKGVRFVLAGEYCPPSMAAPIKDCTCGIYAANSMDAADSYGSILGRVALWGNVVVAEKGWRAQYAYPQALYVPDDKYGDLLPQLARYGVPILKRSAIARMTILAVV